MVLHWRHRNDHTLFDFDESLLHFRIAILPGRTANVVAVEVADGRDISFCRLFLGAHDTARPIQLFAQLVVLFTERTYFKADATAYLFMTKRAGDVGVKRVDLIVQATL